MTCKLWTEKAFPYAEGLLQEAEARAYRAHLDECPECSQEVESSLRLAGWLRQLPDPDVSRTEAFDRVVMTRVHAASQARLEALPGQAAARAAWPVPSRHEHESRAAAARAIADLSRRAGRPKAAPVPSLMLVSLALAAVSITTTIFFGGWIVRTVGNQLTVAAAALGDSGQWLAERAGIQVAELVTLIGVLRDVTADVGPWVEAVHQLIQARGIELTLVALVSVALLGLAGFVLRRDRRQPRAISRR